MVNTQRNSPQSSLPPKEPPTGPRAAKTPVNDPRATESKGAQSDDLASSHESTTHESTMHESDTLPEMVEASMTGQDEPMEREHPKAPGALIWFSYPLALLVGLIVVVIAFALFNN